MMAIEENTCRSNRCGAVLRCAVGVVALLTPSLAIGAGFDPPAPNPRKPVNYVEWLNKYVRRNVTTNAYDAYLKAFAGLTAFPDPDWTDDSPNIRPWVEANHDALQQFLEATQIHDFAFRWEPPGGTGDERLDYLLGTVKIYWLRSWRDASNGLLADSWRYWVGSQVDMYADNVLAVLRASHHLYGSLLLFARFRGLIEAQEAYRTLTKAFVDGRHSDELAAAIAPRLVQDDPPISSLHDQIMMEKLTAWDFAQRLYEPDPEKPGELRLHTELLQWFVDRGAAPFSPLMQAAQLKIGFDGTIKTFDDYYNGMATWSEKPYYRIQPSDREKSTRDAFDHVRTERKNPLGMMIMVSLAEPRTMNEQVKATRRATHLIVHLFDYRREHGSFPKSLNQLQVTNLSQLRVDPFSGSDLKYSSDGAQFKLYSVGDDLADDGGRHTPWEGDGDFVFWPVPQ